LADIPLIGNRAFGDSQVGRGAGGVAANSAYAIGWLCTRRVGPAYGKVRTVVPRCGALAGESAGSLPTRARGWTEKARVNGRRRLGVARDRQSPQVDADRMSSVLLRSAAWTYRAGAARGVGVA
jgi:hypothetical protein